MAEVIPFRGCRYDPAVAGDVAKLIAPPYDVIDADLRGVLFQLSEFNVARIIRADRNEHDPSGNPYAPAAALLADWRARGVIKRDAQPSMYVYEQFFEVHDRKFSRTGLVALGRLEPPGETMLPHENTLPGPRQDRLELMRATHMQFGQVFGLYPDPDDVVDGILKSVEVEDPLIQVADSWGQLHRMWAITNPETIGRIRRHMNEKEILIADGHHRYETALTYAEERPACEAAGYRMMTLVNMSNIGLVVLPIHRLVKAVPKFEAAAFLAELRKAFQVRAYPGDSSAARAAVFESIRGHLAAGRHALGLYLKDGNHYVLVLRREEIMNDIPDHSAVWRRLDVTILHHLVLDRLLGITTE